MDFSQLLQARKSVRSYQSRPVEEWKLDLLIEAVRFAPSASNSQPWKLIIINEPEIRDHVARATYSRAVSFNRFARQAPVLAVLTIERAGIITQIGARLKKREFHLIDIGIAASQFCLQATDLGLGTCMLGWFDEDTIKKLLDIPKNRRIGLIITLGYEQQGEKQRSKVRKSRRRMSGLNRYTS
ncbi:MAG: nitroreductase family protein [Desulfopila sp.]